jgi:hypothetical protein
MKKSKEDLMQEVYLENDIYGSWLLIPKKWK